MPGLGGGTSRKQNDCYDIYREEVMMKESVKNYEAAREHLTPVSYTHLDVYKRQVLFFWLTVIVVSPRCMITILLFFVTLIFLIFL